MSDHYVFEEVNVSAEEVLRCSYSSWSPCFEGNLPMSVVLKPIPRAFVEYLNSESIVLPGEREEEIVADSENEYSDWEDEYSGRENNQYSKEEARGNNEYGNGEVKGNREDPTTAFPDFHEQVKQAIAQLGNQVMVKLNWSAPKDANWILINNSIKCTNVSDVYLLLNASDHIAHDLDDAFNEVANLAPVDANLPSVEHELVLKQWLDINPALEFRVFVHNNSIIGVSQRDLNHYDYLSGLIPQLRDVLDQFWLRNHLDQPNEKLGLTNYVMDIYIPRPFDKVYVIDINPFSRKSDPLLFTWHELIQTTQRKSDDTAEFEWRVINETNMGRFAKKEHSENQVPLEVIDASMNTDAMIELAKKWQKLGTDNDTDGESDNDTM